MHVFLVVARNYFISFNGQIHCMKISHFVIYSSIDQHLDCFHLLTIMDNVAVNIRIQKIFYCVGIPHFVYSLPDEHLGSFYFLGYCA